MLAGAPVPGAKRVGDHHCRGKWAVGRRRTFRGWSSEPCWPPHSTPPLPLSLSRAFLHTKFFRKKGFLHSTLLYTEVVSGTKSSCSPPTRTEQCPARRRHSVTVELSDGTGSARVTTRERQGNKITTGRCQLTGRKRRALGARGRRLCTCSV